MFRLVNNLLVIFIILRETNLLRATKIWTGESLEFMDKKLWESDNSPCSLDKILFPEQYTPAIFTPNTLEINGIILPTDGLVLLPSNVSSIQFSSTENENNAKNHKCKNRDRLAKIKQVQTKIWFDPINWRLNSSSDEINQNSATPHIERIPCSNEKAVINHHGTFSINLEDIERLYSGGLVINGEEMSANELEDFFRMEDGSRFFQDADETEVHFLDEPICGCHRPDTVVDVEWRVCKFMSNKCEKPHCLNPLVPVGHCCHICGAMVKIHVDNNNCKSFNLRLLRKRIESAIKEKNMQTELDFWASTVDDGFEKYVQFIITDRKGYNEKSIELMKYLNESLLKHTYNDMKRTFYSSGIAFSPDQGASGWLFFFLTLLAVAIFFAISIAYFVPENPYFTVPTWIYPNRLRFIGSPFIFSRFENTQTEEEIEARSRNVVMNVTYDEEGNIAEEEEAGPSMESSDLGRTTTSFDNPMFCEKGAEKLKQTDHDVDGEKKTNVDEAKMFNINLEKSENDKN